MPIDPALDPFGQTNPQLRAAQRLAWVEEQQRSASTNVTTLAIPGMSLTGGGVTADVVSTNVEVPGSTQPGGATSAMVSFYALLTFSGPNAGASGSDLRLYFAARNLVWNTTQVGQLISTNDVGTPFFAPGTDYVTAPGIGAARVIAAASVPNSPMGGWVTMPLISGPTEFKFKVLNGSNLTANLTAGFVTFKVDA